MPKKPFKYKKIKFAVLNISLPDEQKKWVQRRVKEGGWGTVSEYVRELIRAERNQNIHLDSQSNEATFEQLEDALNDAEGDERRALARLARDRLKAEPTPEVSKRIHNINMLFETAVTLYRERLKRKHPRWSEVTIDKEVRKWLTSFEDLDQHDDHLRSNPARLRSILSAA